jgi:hypothetical protein
VRVWRQAPTFGTAWRRFGSFRHVLRTSALSLGVALTFDVESFTNAEDRRNLAQLTKGQRSLTHDTQLGSRRIDDRRCDGNPVACRA